MADKAIQLKDPSYYAKIKKIARAYYTQNPDELLPEELVKFNFERNVSRTLRYIIDKEYSRVKDLDKASD